MYRRESQSPGNDRAREMITPMSSVASSSAILESVYNVRMQIRAKHPRSKTQRRREW